MGLFTIEFELGPHTRASIERVARRSPTPSAQEHTRHHLKIEAGPRTLRSISETGAGGPAQEAIKGVIRRGAEPARGGSS
jgi:hypothetical protein